MALKDGKAYANELAYYVFQSDARYAEAQRDDYTFYLQETGDGGFEYGIDVDMGYLLEREPLDSGYAHHISTAAEALALMLDKHLGNR